MEMGRKWSSGGRSRSKSSEANGCISALYHFFHSHHFYFPSRHHHHQPSFDSPSRYPKGLVAPRNSLELTEESSLSTNYKEKDSLNISVGGKRSNLRALIFDRSSDNCNSPSAKSPNLVARLMGLDLLPDNLDLNISSRKSVRGHRHSESGSGTRSLPESPRVSSARKSDSDVRRLSLQLNRENKHEDSVCRRLKDEENQSPGNNERVITRRLGMDITNLLENRRVRQGQDQIKHRKVRSMSSRKENTLSSSPTFVFKQDNISRQQTKTLTLSKDSKKNLKSVDEQPLRPTNVCKKVCSKSKFSPHSTPNNQHKRRQVISTSRCDHLHKKECKQIPNSSAVSASERPRKQMERAEGPEQKEDGTICFGQMYNYEEKLPQELLSSSSSHSTTISATFSNVGRTKIYFEYLTGMKKLEKEEERVVAEVERHIVDALVLETVKLACV
ncbi:uncharacterized protein LOC103834875 [Brassica rapa]|uniref:DUF3741 domain-containing protein n=2 Tax=Brassica TaxID=3705 RepID=A0ABQ8CGZ0_BRANA|nr:uncharacterized protein LOC106359883 [Brassica napus]XP_033133038.1 uncharacterized protein LOC103834875 [Brassica rapa]XP_033133039.1 uncharacterized protein LOC103834875 [Brassica rapa]XP_033133040.1 uncharacterized protein LOC103834875 [Brassica rapa]KAH0915640.1 hypothetical protein HID58_030086 [Brassica napus]CAG7898690.1 unnamed protein product [Brassica rapa]VDD05464.1 unnamed protein product [Brassica rapa]